MIKVHHPKVALTISYNGSERVITKYFEEQDMLDNILSVDNLNPAKLTMSYELSNKSYGNGASVMVSISLNVDQDEGAIQDAALVAKSILAHEAEGALAEAQTLHQKLVK